MTDHYKERADRVVAAFRSRLGEAAAANITDAQFDELSLMIREAMAASLQEAIAKMEALTGELRRETETPDLGL